MISRTYIRKHGMARGEVMRLALMGLPLLLVLVVAGLAMIGQAPFPTAPDPSVRIEIAEIEAATTRRDRNRTMREQARRAAAQAEQARDLLDSSLAEELALADPADLPVVNVVRTLDLPPMGEEGAAPVSRPPSSPPRPPARQAGEAVPADEGVMAVSFDLAGGPRSAGSLRTTRPLVIDDRVAGSIEMRIDNASSIYVSRNGLLGLVPSPTPELRALTGEYVLLSDLRDAGVNLRYDPASDRMILRP